MGRDTADSIGAAAQHREVLQLLIQLEVQLAREDSVSWSALSVPEIARLAGEAGMHRLAGLLLSLKKLHTRAWRIEVTAIEADDADAFVLSAERWASKGWKVLAAEKDANTFAVLLSREAPLDAASELWSSDPAPSAFGSADADADELARALRALNTQNAPALVREVYRLNRLAALFTGLENLGLHLETMLPAAASAAVRAPRGRGARSETASPVDDAGLDVLVRGAHSLATPTGSRALIERCVAAGLREATRQDDPLQLAQWLTFGQLLAIAAGTGDALPDPTTTAPPIHAALVEAVVAAGDEPMLGTPT